MTGPLRALPDFMVVGTQRGGTSSLYKYLGRHPAVAPTLRKETEYFTRGYGNGERWYRGHFPLEVRRTVSQTVNRRRLQTFEATPDYLVHPLAADRAFDLIPNAKMVAMVRNPIDRAYSHYKHMVRLEFERRSFEQAISRELEEITPLLEKMASDPTYDATHFLRYSYLTRGHYAEQLTRWLAHYPEMLIIRSEDFYADTPATFLQILEYLDLEAWQPAEFSNYSYASTPPNDSGLPAHLREQLADHYRPHNAALSQLLGRDFGWDK